MNKISRTLTSPFKWLGVVFILYGFVWGSVIYVRAKLVESSIQKRKTYPQRLQSASNQIKTIEQTLTQTQRMNLKEAQRRAKKYVVFFWCLAISELLVVLFYVGGGRLLFINSPIGKNVALSVIAVDIFFKSAVVGYYYFVMDAFKKILPAQKLYQIYFIPDQSFVSVLSGYFSGAAFCSLTSVVSLSLFAVFVFYILSLITFPDIFRCSQKKISQ
jgi:hypothetical protein